MTKIMNGFDKEVERFVKFWQEERNCIILISQVGESVVMDVMHLADGTVERGLLLGSKDATKEALMVSARRYLKA